MKNAIAEQKSIAWIKLTVVIGVIAGVAAIGIHSYRDYIGRTAMAEALSSASTMKDIVEDIYRKTGSCPIDRSAGSLTITGDGTNAALYVHSLNTFSYASAEHKTTYACGIMASMHDSGITSDVEGRHLTLLATVNAHAVSWTCVSDVRQEYLPGDCVSTHAQSVRKTTEAL